jgi:hypothetical protein
MELEGLLGTGPCLRSILILSSHAHVHWGPTVSYWLRHISASWKVAGSRPDEVNFSIYLILSAALAPGVHSASNRNEYQKQK